MDTGQIVVLIISLLSIVVLITYVYVDSRKCFKNKIKKVENFKKDLDKEEIITAEQAYDISINLDKNNISSFASFLEGFSNKNFYHIMREIKQTSQQHLYKVEIPFYFLFMADYYKKFNLDMIEILVQKLRKEGYRVWVHSMSENTCSTKNLSRFIEHEGWYFFGIVVSWDKEK